MSTVKQFSEKERAYHAYQARQNYVRQQQSIARHIQAIEAERMRERAEKERERAEKEQALASEQRERAEKEAALAEIERLKVLLTDFTPPKSAQSLATTGLGGNFGFHTGAWRLRHTRHAVVNPGLTKY